MNNLLGKRLISLVAILSVALLSGCNSLNTMVSDETKYGQIYMLEEVLADASGDCSNSEHIFDAKQWSRQVSASLGDYVGYLDEQSDPYIESKKLLEQLPMIAGYYGQPNCKAITTAHEQTRTLIATLTAKSIVVARR